MKKYLFAALGAGLLMTSCQSDEPLAPGNGLEQQVAFTVSLPDAVSTRAGGTNSAAGGVSNNVGANVKFNVALYLDGRLVFADKQTVSSTGNHTSATFKPTLVIGENYQLVAFAEFDNDATATGQGENPATNMGLIAMESGINNELNDEYFVSTTLTAAPELSAKLKRPYGKLRLIAEDLAEAERQFGAKVESVEVTYKHTRPTNFNVIAGTFDPAYTEGAQTFAAAYGEYTDEAAGRDRTIFVDYLPGKFDGSESMVPFTVKVIFANGKTYTRDFNQDIPVKRNYLTTLKGRLFTMDSELKLTIEEAFVDEIEINFAEDLEWVAANGGTVTLTEDITLTKALNITKDMVINLNGHTISAANAKGDGAVIEVAEGVSAKLIGGTIENTTPNGDAAINNAGELVLENITIEGAPLADGGYSAYAVISSGKLTIGEGVNVSADRGCLKFSGAGETVINGGNFTNNDIGSRNLTSHVVDVENGGTHKLTINGGTFAHLHTATSGGVVICNRTTGTVYVNGGNFSGGNYYGNDNLSDYGYGGTFVVTGGTYSAKPAAKYIATGCKVEENDGLYYVLATSVSTANQLCNALSVMAITGSTEEITITDDINLSGIEWNQIGTSEKPFAGTLNGNGKKISNLTIANTEYAALIAYTDENAQIKNLTLENVNIRSDRHAAGVVCVAGEGLTIENVKVSGVITAASYAGGIVHNAANVTIKNCENNAKVSANRAGGIASWVTVGANIENVINTGDITGEVGASGIAHGFAGSIKNAVNTGDIKSNNVEAAAGIAGVQKAVSTYEYCYNYGNVTSTYDDANASAAGILGQSAGSASTLKYCANYGNITAVASHAAGIAYSLYGTINASYCYNEGAVNGADGAGAIAPKAQYGTGDKANYCLNAGTITSSNGIVYQGSNNNNSCYYYDGNVLKNVSGNTETTTETAMSVLNGGTDTDFFSVENGKICVK